MRMYHGSKDNTLTQTLHSPIFSGFFFSASEETAYSFGDFVYSVEISDNAILDEKELFNILYNTDEEYTEIRNKLYTNVHHFASYYIEELVLKGYEMSSAEELVEDVILDEKNQDVLYKILYEDYENYGEYLCDIQKIRGEAAFASGFIAVTMRDETGQSYLVRPDIHIERLSTDDPFIEVEEEDGPRP